MFDITGPIHSFTDACRYKRSHTTSSVNLTDAKARLPYTVARAVQGEEKSSSSREGEPVARLVGMEPERKRRPVGLGAGRFHIPPDFDTLASAEIIQSFEGHAE